MNREQFELTQKFSGVASQAKSLLTLLDDEKNMLYSKFEKCREFYSRKRVKEDPIEYIHATYNGMAFILGGNYAPEGTSLDVDAKKAGNLANNAFHIIEAIRAAADTRLINNDVVVRKLDVAMAQLMERTEELYQNLAAQSVGPVFSKLDNLFE